MQKMRTKQDKKNGFLTFKTFFIMIFFCVCSLLYIWQHIVIIQIGYKTHKNEIAFERLLDEKARMQSLVAQLETPSNIKYLLASNNIHLQSGNKQKIIKIKL